ncbi:hypothetical protein PROFUN_10007 [Planoprotostelium fungivorum]|uniref:Uncharacterized protein n=1 Tax=Planoprotostelium fungivorum TaxID=1890364 RepID=A0A2P6NFU4_9EUKA|nr:hypothetical protein PROFUN_10007 [Planoprotostelium fungivorum]
MNQKWLLLLRVNCSMCSSEEVVVMATKWGWLQHDGRGHKNDIQRTVILLYWMLSGLLSWYATSPPRTF